MFGYKSKPEGNESTGDREASRDYCCKWNLFQLHSKQVGKQSSKRACRALYVFWEITGSKKKV